MYIPITPTHSQPPPHHLAKRDGMSGGTIIAVIILVLVLTVIMVRGLAMVIWKQPFCPGCDCGGWSWNWGGRRQSNRGREGGPKGNY
ncbi:hypothetical protein F4810DRAFT_707739 [Camillea tinctor]|nr:hypothetical protein F4810DRAFT_707739 [Camillea tinctor]